MNIYFDVMKVFTINRDGKLIEYKEREFCEIKGEEDLEELLEYNPEYFFKGSKVMIIGRQVRTNLNSFIDLLGIDISGNTVVVELKRGKTPRETLAQLLEYASFVQNLNYEELNEIYRLYTGADRDLEDEHRQFFNQTRDEQVSFNKSTKLMIVAQEISREIKQTALFLRRVGVDIYCIEFKYFETTSGEQIITNEFIVGEDDFIKESMSIEKNKEDFFKMLDKNSTILFKRIFTFAEENDLSIKWGAKGFSLNVNINEERIALFFGFPINSPAGQSICTSTAFYDVFDGLKKKVKNGRTIARYYEKQLIGSGLFKRLNNGLKWYIDGHISGKDVDRFLHIVNDIVGKIKQIRIK